MFALKAMLEATRLSSREPDREKTEVIPEKRPDELGEVRVKVTPPVKL